MPVVHLLLTAKVGLDHGHKGVFAFAEPLNQGLFRVLGEVLILDDKVMQVVSQVLST